jgi:transcriptional regulator with XRE-family HTH domain
MAPLAESERREFKRLIRSLERARKDLGWPQEKIASLCGVTQETYSRWVSGRSEPWSGLVLAGLKARVPQIIAELKASQRKLQRLLRELESLRSGGE